MENFIVSARKYRPATFNMVVGQDAIVKTLKNAIKNKQLAQAFLFCGPRGVGKTTTARIFAKTINCEHITSENEACNECESCKSFNTLSSFNIHELDAASNNSVEDIRTLVDQVRIPPQAGDYKVYIIDEVHMLSTQAFNAFLKTLEEPPSYAKFILATTEKNKIIPTILSRCQIYDFKRITIDDIASHLAFVADSEGITYEKDALHIIAQKSDGALRDALSMFDQIVSFGGTEITYQHVIENLNVLDYDYYFRITNHIFEGNISEILLIINEILANGFDGQHFLVGFGEHLRNLLVSKDPATLQLLEVGENIKRRYLEQSKIVSQDFLIKSLDKIGRLDLDYKSSYNKSLHLETGILQLVGFIGQQILKEKQEHSLPDKPSAYNAKEKSVVKPNAPKVESTREIKQEIKEKKPTYPRTTSIKVQEESMVKEPERLHKKNDSDFTQDMLDEAWKQTIASFEDQPSLFSTLKAHVPVLQEDFMLKMEVDGKVQREFVEDVRNEIVEALRESLKNDRIKLKLILMENAIKKKVAYTPKEKLDRLKEKNPAIIKMKDQLGLDLEY